LLTEAARLMVHTDVAMEVTTDAVQLFGGTATPPTFR
jgi:hypothetical protein